MSKIANYLANHLRGEVVSTDGIKETLSTDASIYKVKPILAAYPFDTSDVRKITHFAWQLAEKGHVLPLTVRGSGGSRVGAAIGNGAIVSMPSHFSTIFEVDTKQRLVRLQPGVKVDSLCQAMKLHGLEWPIEVSSQDGTVGGAIANNTYGERATRYGDVSDWVSQLEVVLSNGDIIQTERLSKRQLSKKKGQSGLEGDIYRKLDALIDDNAETIATLNEKLTSAGYAISKVKDKRGNFDLTPLILGSQGTLGVVTEAILKLSPNLPQVESVAVTLSTLDNIDELIKEVLKSGPDRFEFVDGKSLEIASVDLSEVLPDGDDKPALHGMLFIEYRDVGRKARVKGKKIAKTIEKFGHQTAISDGDADSASEIWQVYARVEAAASLGIEGQKMPIPLVEDALLPSGEVAHFIEAAHELGKKHSTKFVFTAHIGTGVVHARALLNLKNLSDRNKSDKLKQDYYELVAKHDGGTAGEYAEGRTRLAQNKLQFTSEEIHLFEKIKRIFDVYHIFNPGVKIATSKDTTKINEDYNPSKNADNLQRL